MPNRCSLPSYTPWRRAWVWGLACAILLLLPAVGSSQRCPVPEAELNEVWQRAIEAYDMNDCVRFVQAASRYYGLVNHSTFSWDTLEIGRAYNYCVGVLDSALRERDLLRNENAELRRSLRAGGGGVK